MSEADATFSIHNHTDGSYSIPELPFSNMKSTVLGDEYDLSLVFIQDDESTDLNEQYRNKSGPTNVLSFPVGEGIGEVYINRDAVLREHEQFETDPESFAGYLFIHALLHLKGYSHGSKMEREERKICKQFDIEITLS